MIKLKYQTVFNEVDELKEFREPIYERHNYLHGLPKPDEEVKGFTGWVDLPVDEESNESLIKKIVKTRRRLKRLKIDTLVVVGVGGSMLGARAVYEFLRPDYSRLRHEDQIELVFLGYTMNERHFEETLKYLKGKNYAINIISKSGETLEIKMAMHIIFERLREKYKTHKEFAKRVIVTSLKESPLHDLAKEKKYEFYEMPHDISGRYSTLTATGLLPLGIADIKIQKLIKGAQEAYEELIYPVPQNPAYLYACSRAALYSRGVQKIELGIVFEPSMEHFLKWWRQIFAESEGKNGWGLFPGIALYTSELHSLGQWIQEGDSIRTFECFHIVRQEGHLSLDKELLPEDKQFLGEHPVSDMEYAVLRGTLDAHRERMAYLDNDYTEKHNLPIPHIVFEWDDYSEETIGYALYFFQKAAAMYCLLLGVNPFDQPGVDAYKEKALEYIMKGIMYEEVEDVVLDYTPPAVDFLKATEEEEEEREMIEELKDDELEDVEIDEPVIEVDEDFEYDESIDTEDLQLDETDIQKEFDELDDQIDEDWDTYSEEELKEAIHEESPDVRVRVDVEKEFKPFKERVGIEEVGEIRITIKPNRPIVFPSSVIERPIETTSTKKTRKRTTKKTTKKATKKATKKTPKKATKKTTKKATKKTAKKKTIKNFSTASSRKVIYNKSAVKSKHAFITFKIK